LLEFEMVLDEQLKDRGVSIYRLHDIDSYREKRNHENIFFKQY